MARLQRRRGLYFSAGAAMALSMACGEAVRNDTPVGAGFAVVAPMSVSRAVHTSTLLQDGSVLITGGFGGEEEAPHATTELFDPATSRFLPAARMLSPRQDHTATPLQDGRVLIAGGFAGTSLASAELYDPGADRFEPTGSLTTARNGHKAVRLQNGRVLIGGGDHGNSAGLASAEVYDPTTGRFTATGPMTVPRSSHTATLLPSGQILVTGGHEGQPLRIYDSAELYDPATGVFRPTGSMTRIRHKHDAVAQRDGRVLIVGGADARDENGVYDSVEAYDPAAGSFSPVGRMRSARYKNQETSVPLLTGQVLLAGGAAVAEVYDPAAATFERAQGEFGDSLLFAAATRLQDGRVLVTGGYGRRTFVRANAWVLTP